MSSFRRLLVSLSVRSSGTLTSLIALRESRKQREEGADLRVAPLPMQRSRPLPYAAIVIGGGTSGCTTAYLLSKWLLEAKLQGRVLLVERGGDASGDDKMSSWMENWALFGEAHPTVRRDGLPSAVTASSHCGLGGSSTHDTRISFGLRAKQREQFAGAMGVSPARLDTFMQASLDLMPLSPAISPPGEAYFEAVIRSLTEGEEGGDGRKLNRAEGGEFKARILGDTIACASVAMNAGDERRWTPGLLVREPPIGARPSNLDVLCNATCDRIVLRRFADQKLSAIGAFLVPTIATVVQGAPFILSAPAWLELESADVSLCAGALHNPAILQRSGVGPPELLAQLGIPLVVPNDAVGHGVDHNELPLVYEAPLASSRGGAMGWPLVLFATNAQNELYQAHVGGSRAAPYYDSDAEIPVLVATPNNASPDMSCDAGFRVSIESTSPCLPPLVTVGDVRKDVASIISSVRATDELFKRRLGGSGLIGARIEPPPEIDLEDTSPVATAATGAWANASLGTAYHWACTTRIGCSRGVGGEAVANEKFQVLDTTRSGGVVNNLRVGSASSLPALPEANPHLLITATSVALAYTLLVAVAQRQGAALREPLELVRASESLSTAGGGTLTIRRPGNERPQIVSRPTEGRGLAAPGGKVLR